MRQTDNGSSNLLQSFEQKDTLIGWKTAISALAAVFMFGMASTIYVTQYISNVVEKTTENYVSKESNAIQQQQILVNSKMIDDLKIKNMKTDEKFNSLIGQQSVILSEIAKINGRLEEISKKR